MLVARSLTDSPRGSSQDTLAIVDADGAGDFRDFEEAVGMAGENATILVRREFYEITRGDLSPAAGVTIQGEGYGTHLRLRDGANPNVFAVQAPNVTLRSLGVDGNGGRQLPASSNGIAVWGRASNNTNTFLTIEGITQSSDTGSNGYFSQNGGRSRTSPNGTITLESSGALTNNVVVIRIGTTVTGNTAATSQGALALVFDGGITDRAGNTPNNATAASTFKLF